MNAFAFTATCLVTSKEAVPKFLIVQNVEQEDTHRTDAPISHRGSDMRAKLANPETNRKGMKISQFSSHHNKCLQCAGDHQTANCT